MKKINLKLQKNKKLYFAGDFHLGRPNEISSIQREKHIVKWLDTIKKDAQEIFLMGDIFDFWFEYKKTVPKGYIRLLGKLIEIIEEKINIHYFVGNHDMWTLDYFQNLGIKVYHNPTEFNINHINFLIGHGDGLGKGDKGYKLLKNLFKNKILQFLFRILHPDIGIVLGEYFSRKNNNKIDNTISNINDERIVNYCKDYEINNHKDIYVFGHSHKVTERQISEKSKYYNVGEWIYSSHYLESDCKYFKIKKF